MTTRTAYMTTFLSVAEEMAKQAIADERGLGGRFGAAFKELLEENPKATDEELVVLFDKAMAEMEDHVRDQLVDAFDSKKATLYKACPRFAEYKSRYRSALMTMGNECRGLTSWGPGAIYKATAEAKAAKRKATQPQPENKGPDNATSDEGSTGSTDAGHGGNNTGKSGGSTQQLDPKVQAKVDNYVKALAKMPVDEALRIATNSDSIAWKALKQATDKVAKFANKNAA